MYKLLFLVLSLIIVSCTSSSKDSVEFVATYKNCMVIDKKVRNQHYYIKVYKPHVDKIETVEVPPVVYLNMYFVGDTIR